MGCPVAVWSCRAQITFRVRQRGQTHGDGTWKGDEIGRLGFPIDRQQRMSGVDCIGWVIWYGYCHILCPLSGACWGMLAEVSQTLLTTSLPLLQSQSLSLITLVADQSHPCQSGNNDWFGSCPSCPSCPSWPFLALSALSALSLSLGPLWLSFFCRNSRM